MTTSETTDTETAYHEALAELLGVDAQIPEGEPGTDEWYEAEEELSEARSELAEELAARYGLDPEAVADSIFRQHEVRHAIDDGNQQ